MAHMRLVPLHSRLRSIRPCPSLSKPSTASQSLFSNGFTPRSYSRTVGRPSHQRSSRPTNRPFSTDLCRARPTPGYALLAAALGLGALVSGATVYALESPDSFADPLEALSPDTLRLKTAHVTQKPCQDLLRSYLTLLLCEMPGVATYGPILLNHCISLRDNVPVIGPAAWTVVEWFVYHTFFSHYTGGESAEDCQPVMEALYAGKVGSLLNYSVEALERSGGGGKESGLSLESVAAISRAVDSLAGYELGAKGYAPGSARMKPSSVAIKVSGLVEDPYLFKRASENLQANGLSPFRARGSPFPKTSPSSPDPLSPSDHLALDGLMDSLRSICQKAKSADIVLMIDAEYSWFQPALDRIATFLSAEFNKAQPKGSKGESYSPTVFNTFQALLRSTPARLAEFVDEGHQQGFSVGVKLVRGAYLVSETAKWREARAAGQPDVPEHPPVWGSKAETDGCFDDIASSLVQRLANNARRAEGLTSHPRQSTTSSPIEVAMMIAGHNPLSAAKVLKQLRDEEGLAKNMDSQCISLSDSLRGRLMFAQLYGMADNLTSTLTDILAPSDAGQRQPQPFVFKYLPFGPVDKVLPYLARRAEENSSILEVKDGESVLSLERKLIGKEIRKRIGSLFFFS
ncbi:hypothetical protein MJO28_013898 [Puccinia striiformis f. sp. tritici]|uniref:Proline dehydrogenase n=3 Tax=Puccinia striiformis TaxID=27350 RepID=A0A0L0V7U7_9BASI|nr:hypothetical protein MJO28_013898 [Puccinia striiformis f. sp. tritici]KAI7941668.1 hypothetical protein MJO29_013742 [Puccinia striiformis f. sp. tritici]KNE95352.1 hypothetical protein PSTG_11336 [Puccinia striiformis f. sp. tritici PST-78]POW04084.1 hypothetical protein PSTT_10636 [Puccinia striiformis]